jgi:hypothetical protein
LETRENTSDKAPRNPPTTTAQDGFPSMPAFSGSNIGDTAMSGILQDTVFVDSTLNGVDNLNLNGDFSWEMLGLGLEEPLPAREVIDELYEGSLT